MEMLRQLQQQLLLVDAGSILELVEGTSAVVAAAAACIKLPGAAAGLAETRLPFEPAGLQQYSENSVFILYSLLTLFFIQTICPIIFFSFTC